MATSVIFQQPQPTSLIAVHSNQWSTGICGCFDDCHVCCFAYWCFPCFACSTASDFGECFCLPLMDALWAIPQLAGLCVMTPPISMAMRTAVRNRYGIQGDMTSDCVYATFCNTCSWCQMAREIKRRAPALTVINVQPTIISAAPMVLAAQPAVMAPQSMLLAPQPMVIAPQPTVIAATQSTVMTTRIC